MTDSIFDKERWQRFGNWLRHKRTVMIGSPARAGRLVGISGEQWQLIERGLIPLDKETVIRLGEALLSDITDACNQAGYAPPDDYVHVPMLVRLLNYLPLHVKADIARQVEALHEVYFDKESKQRPASWYSASRELGKDMRKKLDALEASQREAEKAGAELDSGQEIIELDDDNIA